MIIRLTSVHLAPVFLAVVGLCSADTLTLRDGRVINGEYIGGDARHIRMAIGDHVDTFDVDKVVNLQFGRDPNAAPPPPPAAQGAYQGQYPGGNNQGFAQQPPPPPAPAQNQGFAQQPPPPPPAAAGLQIPSGTRVTVRMIDSVDSNTAHLGQTFRASIDEPILVNGQVLIPRGADALTKLVQDQQSGKFEGKTILTLELTSITVNGQTFDATTASVTQASSSRGSRTAKVVGGTTALGAIVGALAGGGRGAAIGAASGAAVGGTAQVLTKGQQVKIPSETRLTFTLQQPIQF